MSNFELKSIPNNEYDEYGKLGEGENSNQYKMTEYRNKILTCRNRLINELQTEEMIKIMFEHFIKTQNVDKIIELGEKYLKN